jgi:hypothetical protein
MTLRRQTPSLRARQASPYGRAHSECSERLNNEGMAHGLGDR